MSQAIQSQGIVLARGDGGLPTEVFTKVAEVVSMKGPGGNAKVIDVTSLDSVAVEKIMGLPDEGQITFGCNLIPADAMQVGLRADRATRTLRNFKITLTDALPTHLTFAAYVLGFSVDAPSNQQVKADITLEITGPVTWA